MSLVWRRAQFSFSQIHFFHKFSFTGNPGHWHSDHRNLITIVRGWLATSTQMTMMQRLGYLATAHLPLGPVVPPVGLTSADVRTVRHFSDFHILCHTSDLSVGLPPVRVRPIQSGFGMLRLGLKPIGQTLIGGNLRPKLQNIGEAQRAIIPLPPIPVCPQLWSTVAIHVSF